MSLMVPVQSARGRCRCARTPARVAVHTTGPFDEGPYIPAIDSWSAFTQPIRGLTDSSVFGFMRPRPRRPRVKRRIVSVGSMFWTTNPATTKVRSGSNRRVVASARACRGSKDVKFV